MTGRARGAVAYEPQRGSTPESGAGIGRRPRLCETIPRARLKIYLYRFSFRFLILFILSTSSLPLDMCCYRQTAAQLKAEGRSRFFFSSYRSSFSCAEYRRRFGHTADHPVSPRWAAFTLDLVSLIHPQQINGTAPARLQWKRERSCCCCTAGRLIPFRPRRRKRTARPSADHALSRSRVTTKGPYVTDVLTSRSL